MVGAQRTHAVRLIALVAIILLLQACTSTAYLPWQQTIGRLRTIGPNVYVNDKPARDGQMVSTKDRIRTGGDSSAYIYFPDGSFVQFDRNTD